MISPATAKRVVRLLVAGFVLQMGMIGYVFYQSYTGRSNVVDYQRNDCEGRKKSVGAAILVDSAILMAFKDTDKRNQQPLTEERIQAETTIAEQIPKLVTRLNLDCNKAFPKEGFLP